MAVRGRPNAVQRPIGPRLHLGHAVGYRSGHAPNLARQGHQTTPVRQHWCYGPEKFVGIVLGI